MWSGKDFKSIEKMIKRPWQLTKIYDKKESVNKYNFDNV